MAGQRIFSSIAAINETLNHGQRNVTVAGTPVQFSVTSVPCSEVLIQVKRTNTGRIYIGGAGVTNNDTAGVMLEAPVAGTTPASILISAQNLNQIFLNTTVNANGVTFIYW